MIAGYLESRTDRGTWLAKSLAGSLPGLKVNGPVLEGRQSVEGRMAEFGMVAGANLRRMPEPGQYGSSIDYDLVLRNHLGLG